MTWHHALLIQNPSGSTTEAAIWAISPLRCAAKISMSSSSMSCCICAPLELAPAKLSGFASQSARHRCAAFVCAPFGADEAWVRFEKVPPGSILGAVGCETSSKLRTGPSGGLDVSYIAYRCIVAPVDI